MDSKLSRETLSQVDKMVERVGRKAGYTGRENMSYKEILQDKIERSKSKLDAKVKKYKRKLSVNPSDRDFAEEIRVYLIDSIKALMDEGYSEEDAVRVSREKFDETEGISSFEEYFDAWEKFGLDRNGTMEWYIEQGETIGLFMAAFVVLGLTLGAFVSFLAGAVWQTILICTCAGLLLGVGGGLLAMAILSYKKRKR